MFDYLLLISDLHLTCFLSPYNQLISIMQNIILVTVALFQLMAGISALQVLVALSKERLKLASLVAENKAQMCKAVEGKREFFCMLQ